MGRDHITFCRICEPYCGLIATVDDGRITALRPDRDHPLSRGFACKKGLNAHHLAHDAHRVTRPQRRTASGDWETISWDVAIAEIAAKIGAIRGAHGPHAVGLYVGNPASFAYPHKLYASGFADALGTRNVYGAGSTDNLSIFVASHLLFGATVRIPIPDIDRTDHLLMLGVNPAVSHATLINLHRPLERIRRVSERGGRVVVIDPRRTETARLATSHHFIRPDTDAWLLLAMLAVIFDEGLVDHAFLSEHTRDASTLRQTVAPFTPERAAGHTGIDAATIRTLARDFALAPSAACYARVAVGRFGTLASWAAQLLNVVTGNLDRPGGVLFGDAYADVAQLARWGGLSGYGETRSRIGGHPAVMGELPSGILADEITTPGDGQIRALIIDSGNPAVSTAGGAHLSQALEQLELLVAIDLQRNESHAHAHYFLPATSMFERADFPLVHASLMADPYAQWTEAVIPPVGEAREEWTIYTRLSDALGLDVLNQRVLSWARRGLGALGRRLEPSVLLDALLRLGPLGDRYGLRRGGLSLAKLKANPHGVELEAKRTGVLKARLCTPDKRVALWDPRLAPEIARLVATEETDVAADAGFDLSLIGRRDPRSHNSWMHHIGPLMKRRCVALRMHPDDAQARGLADGAQATVESGGGSVAVEVQLSGEVMPGVVSLPHGWSRVATGHPVHDAHPGANANALTDRAEIEPLAGMAFLNGVPVRVLAAGAATPKRAVQPTKKAAR